MKTNLMIGMLIVCSFQISLAAGPVRNAQGVKETLAKEIAQGEKAGTGAQARSQLSRLIQSTANTLSRIVKGASETDLRAALNRKITIKDPAGDRVIDLLEIGQTLAKADQGLRKLNRNELDAAGKAHLESVESAIQAAAEFLAMASRTSDMKPEALMTPQEKLEVAAFNKQLSLIPEMLTKMDKASIDSHVAALKSAVASRTSPEMTGDQAFAAHMKKTHGKDYLAKLKELMECAG